MPRGRIGAQRQLGPEGDPQARQNNRIPVKGPAPSTLVDMTGHQEEMRFDPSKPSRRFEPDAAAVVRGTPVGAAGIKPYHLFPNRMVFTVDDERKYVPAPNITQQPRRSLFQQYQRWHYQFHINPDWGRKNGQYPRFSFINLIANTGNQEGILRGEPRSSPDPKKNLFGVQGQRPRPRFTKVLRYPRQDATPETYGRYGE